MVKIEENRLMILENDGEWLSYKKEVGKLHNDCIMDYCGKKGLGSMSDINEIVLNTNSVVYYNISDDMGVAYLPEVLSDDQLYQLELFDELCLDNVEYLRVKKVGLQEEDFRLDTDVASRFSNEVIQSYYNKDSKKTK